MPITTWTVAYGLTFHGNIQGHPSLNEIRADGAVDPAFQQTDDEFIPTIQDARVRDFVLTGLPPQADWQEVAPGEWSREHQRLSAKEGKVTLHSWILENGERVNHFITAPYKGLTGQIILKSSFEGFKITAP